MKIKDLILALSLSLILFRCDPDPEPALTCNFTWNPFVANTGETVSFINASKGNPTEFTWSFEGGNPTTSSEENPSVQFNDPGDFEVRLTIMRGGVAQSKTNKISIKCTQNYCMPIVSNFISNTTFIMAGNSIQFNDQSTGDPTIWEWTFEGGSPETSAEQNPNVKYDQPGFYKVTLKASKENSTDTKIEENYVTVGCSGNYCDPIFTKFAKTSGVVYGIDVDHHQLNLYEPENDASEKRPLIILFGGGAFSGSNIELLEPLATQLTRYGYVVASARYRNGPQNEGADNMFRGQQDLTAAVRYFRKMAVEWRIDPDKIFIGGNGTGAFIALGKAYLDTSEVTSEYKDIVESVGGLEGTQGNEGFSSEAIGCISLAGGMYQSMDMITSDDLPLFAVHGTADTEVPYNFNQTIPTYGSYSITQKVKSAGLLSYLYTIENGDHTAPRSQPELYINQLITWCHLVIEK
jgi:PKD repeat protein